MDEKRRLEIEEEERYRAEVRARLERETMSVGRDTRPIARPPPVEPATAPASVEDADQPVAPASPPPQPPAKQKFLRLGCLPWFLIGSFLLFLAAGSLDTEDSAAPTEETYTPPEPRSVHNQAEVEVACEAEIKSQLVAPSTAKFPGMFSPDYRPAVWLAKREIWSQLVHVDAQNGFGATIRTEFLCFMSEDGTLAVTTVE